MNKDLTVPMYVQDPKVYREVNTLIDTGVLFASYVDTKTAAWLMSKGATYEAIDDKVVSGIVDFVIHTVDRQIDSNDRLGETGIYYM